MNATLSEDRKRLILSVNSLEQKELCALGNAIHQDETMHLFLEPIAPYAGFDWIYASETGDLTDAPMLGFPIQREDMAETFVSERWAWREYEIYSLLEQLRDHGTAILVS